MEEKTDFAKSMTADNIPAWNTPHPDTIAALREEMVKARKKFPRNGRLTIALAEELGELAKAELQGRQIREIQKEALQVACVALRIFEEGDADFYNLTEAEKKP